MRPEKRVTAGASGTGPACILIGGESEGLCLGLITALRERGHRAQWARTGEDVLRAARDGREPDLVVLDLDLAAGGMDGLDTLRRLRAQHAGLPVVILASTAGVEQVVGAMKAGATDVLVKPADAGALVDSAERLLRPRLESRRKAPLMVGRSGSFRKAWELARRFAVPEINILLIGETGTGKEIFARAIHAASRRAGGPFVPVDCSTLAETLIESELFGHEKGSFTGATASRIGRFELAQGGTLFLDEIGNLPLPVQAKLLRVLQTRQLERVGGRDSIKLDVRVVSATNVNLQEAIAAGGFRQDLYFRLQEVTIQLPPLRERDGDIERIASYFVRVYAQRFELPVQGISPDARDVLRRYGWPGNVRELENAMKAAVVLATDFVRPEHLPPHLVAAVSGNGAGLTVSAECRPEEERLRLQFELGLGASEVDLKALGARAAEQAERSLLEALIRRGLRSCAHLARMVSVDPKTLRQKLRRYGLEPRTALRRENGDVPPPPEQPPNPAEA